MIRDQLVESLVEYDSQSEQAVPALRAALEWIEKMLGISITYREGFRNVLSSGEVLCKLMNVIVPGAIRRINHCPNRASAMDNLSLFLNACEEKCGIPRSKLFSVDDFEDIFDRKLESNFVDEKGAKRNEKVVISLLWLAKYADHAPKCKDLPKLDYEAFLGLLSKTLIRSSSLFSSGDGFSSETKAPQETEKFSRRTFSCEVPIQQQVNFEETLDCGNFAEQECSLRIMGNTLSTSPTPTTAVKEPLRHDTPSPASELPSEKQINNSGMEEDEWQADLFDWCERRRKLSRMHATKMMTFEEVQQEEELRRQEAIKDRMRQIKAQRSLGADPYFPSSSVLKPIPPSSPGMALLICGGSQFFDNSDDISSNESKVVAKDSNAVDESSMVSGALDTVVSNGGLGNSPLNGFHGLIAHSSSSESIAHKTVDIKTMDQNKDEVLCKNSLTTPCIVSPTPEEGTVSPAENGLREIRICIQSNSKSVEPRWGMTIRAEGPSLTAPFVVDRVKIGSTADVCEVTKGDVLLELNGTDLRRNHSVLEACTLQQLEHLMDQCSLNSKPVDLRILRRRSQHDDLSDCDLDNGALIDGLIDKLTPLDSPAYNSDVDHQEFPADVVMVKPGLLPSDSATTKPSQCLEDHQTNQHPKMMTINLDSTTDSGIRRYNPNSQTDTQRWTLDLPLKEPLNAHI